MKKKGQVSVEGLNLLRKDRKRPQISPLGNRKCNSCHLSYQVRSVSSRDEFRRTGPAAPRFEGSVDRPVVGLPVHVEICFYKMCRDRLLVQRVGGHLKAGS